MRPPTATAACCTFANERHVGAVDRVHLHVEHVGGAALGDTRREADLRVRIAVLARVGERLVEREAEHHLVNLDARGGAHLGQPVGAHQRLQPRVHVADGALRTVRTQLEVNEQLPVVAPPLGLVEHEPHPLHQLDRSIDLLMPHVLQARDDAIGQAVRCAALA
eukprot:4398253-Pleurochrysis_carterae.AAC.2